MSWRTIKVLCIKSVIVDGDTWETAGKEYRITHKTDKRAICINGDDLIHHNLGRSDSKWFKEHFKTVK